MKLASIALLLGGTALGTQIAGGEVHEELHTKRLVMHSEDGARTATITSERAGLLIAVGDEESLTRAEFRLRPEVHSWWLSFGHESGAEFAVELKPGGANQHLAAGKGSAVAAMSAWDFDDPGGSAFVQFHPGGDAVPGEACSIGVDSGALSEVGPSGYLRLRRQVEIDNSHPDQLDKLWVNVLQISGDQRSLVSPWVEKPR
ncbi:MAG: hypothetical protein H6831_09705 [Planctomycetes bacterium]|nr:hypothetical protein [Planctomycetota bacterium]MCB9904668.1 hypothetical protein [Planctomycetota bacterium]